MNFLAMARHASFVRNRAMGTQALTQDGCFEMGMLSWNLAALLKGMSVLILASTAPRVSDCVDILMRTLEDRGISGVALERCKFLNTDEVAPNAECLDRLGQLIEQKAETVDAIIVVAHQPHCENFPRRYVDRKFGVFPENVFVNTAEALLVNCSTGEITKVNHY